ncbi:hypothetical protein PLICRDRAFT_172408 [Plicaturopsis crispa FD-325 SS-3]|nr:hypothetical protein PLICRDRAFT_172408 [Plicaturopsis crispa FD-325 SS-3]
MSTTTPFAWVATDYTRHTSTKLVNLSNKRSIPAGKRMDGLSDYERTTFSTATKKDGSAAELEEWVTGPGRDYVLDDLYATLRASRGGDSQNYDRSALDGVDKGAGHDSRAHAHSHRMPKRKRGTLDVIPQPKSDCTSDGPDSLEGKSHREVMSRKKRRVVVLVPPIRRRVAGVDERPSAEPLGTYRSPSLLELSHNVTPGSPAERDHIVQSSSTNESEIDDSGSLESADDPHVNLPGDIPNLSTPLLTPAVFSIGSITNNSSETEPSERASPVSPSSVLTGSSVGRASLVPTPTGEYSQTAGDTLLVDTRSSSDAHLEADRARRRAEIAERRILAWEAVVADRDEQIARLGQSNRENTERLARLDTTARALRQRNDELVAELASARQTCAEQTSLMTTLLDQIAHHGELASRYDRLQEELRDIAKESSSYKIRCTDLLRENKELHARAECIHPLSYGDLEQGGDDTSSRLTDFIGRTMVSRLSRAHVQLHDIVDENPLLPKDISVRLVTLAAAMRKTCTEATAYSALCTGQGNCAW